MKAWVTGSQESGSFLKKPGSFLPMEPRVKTSGPIQRPLWGDISRLESGQAV